MNFLKLFSSTPLYAYGILIYLIIVGIIASKDRIVSLYKILLLSGIITYLSISALMQFQLDYMCYMIFGGMVTLSYLGGWWSVSRKAISIDQEKKRIALPGSWITLFLVLTIFISKYYVGFKSHQIPHFADSMEAKFVVTYTSALSLGLIWGRLSNFLFRFKVSPHKDLSKKPNPL